MNKKLLYICMAFGLGMAARADTLLLTTSGTGGTKEQRITLTPSTTLRVSAGGAVEVLSSVDFRAAIGLGNAAEKSVGTTAGTVAEGDDARIIAGGTALQPDGNGSGLTDMSWPQIGSTPTTVSGYGITDTVTVTSGTASVPASGSGVKFVPSGTAAAIGFDFVPKGAGTFKIGGKLVTLGDNFNTGGFFYTANTFIVNGAFPLTLRVTAATDITLPVSGTLATVAQVDAMLPLAGGTVTGSVAVNGNLTAGDAAGDSLTINAGTVTAANATDVSSNRFANVGALDQRYKRVIIAYKAASTSRSLTTTFTADPDLVVALEAGATYLMEFQIVYTSATETPGFKSNYSYTGTISRMEGVTRRGQTNTNTASTLSSPDKYGSPYNPLWLDVTTQDGFLVSTGIITTTDAGTFSVTWSQKVSDATITKLGRGSFIRFTKID